VAHNSFGSALASQGKLSGAVAEFERALQLDPNYVSARRNMGMALMVLGRPAEAAVHFREILRLWPDDAWAQTSLAQALQKEGGVAQTQPSPDLPMPNGHTSRAGNNW